VGRSRTQSLTDHHSDTAEKAAEKLATAVKEAAARKRRWFGKAGRTEVS
jgi:hypothetical protein